MRSHLDLIKTATAFALSTNKHPTALLHYVIRIPSGCLLPRRHLEVVLLRHRVKIAAQRVCCASLLIIKRTVPIPSTAFNLACAVWFSVWFAAVGPATCQNFSPSYVFCFFECLNTFLNYCLSNQTF